MASKTPTDITLYTVGTPNGIKVSILLEELNLDYKVSSNMLAPDAPQCSRSGSSGLFGSCKSRLTIMKRGSCTQ